MLNIMIIVHSEFLLIIHWSKVLTDQQGLCRFSRKHKIVKNLKTATIKQVIYSSFKFTKKCFSERVIM